MDNLNYDLIKKYILESTTIAEVLRKLNLDPRGRNYKKIHDVIDQLHLDTSHFLGKKHLKNKVYNINWDEILIEKSPVIISTSRKQRLIKDGLLIYKCYNQLCGLTSWLDNEIVLQLDHINGINDDNRLENLRLLCPNCHSQTSTFAGRNLKGKKRSNSIYKNNVLMDICDCGKEKTARSAMCKECFNKHKSDNLTKIKWPPHEHLIQMIKASSYLQVSKKLGVSDNAIRKRLRSRGLII